MGVNVLNTFMGHHHMGSVVIMSLESKINNLIDKYQSRADNYHRIAEKIYNQGYFEKSVDTDKLAHPYEEVAAELRLLIK